MNEFKRVQKEATINIFKKIPVFFINKQQQD